jgi:hypothetical protein
MAANGGAPLDFNRDIRPIFSDNCYSCHGPDRNKRKAGLRLDQREGVLSRLESGDVALVPGNPDKSKLLRLVTSPDDEERMPPVKTGKHLNAEQAALLRRWIQEGAEWKPHWAYIPPVRPPAPEVHDAAWPRNEIDRFILARLEKEGMKPSEEADRRTLARRVTLDLTGLPPTPGEVDAFLNDTSPGAYEKLVDRLMSLPAFGEKLAIQWLDLARFADSDGYHADIPRSMWQYREYVVDSFNRNRPFDQFVTEQLAGDLLPNPTLDQRIATAFNRNGMSSTEGGADPDEYMNKYVTDRVNTFGTVFLGSTIQCTECHDHKYDPFTQREYYQLYDFFNRVPEKGLDSDPAPPFVKVPSPEQSRALEQARLHVRVVASVHEEKLSRPNPVWDDAQVAWEKRILQGGTETEGIRLGEWRSVGPFAADSATGAFKNEFGPEKDDNVQTRYQEGKLAWQSHPDWKDGKVQALEGDNSAVYLFRTLTAEQARSVTLYLGSDDGIRGWLNGREFIAKDVSRAAAPNQDEARVELQKGENRLLLKISNGGGEFGFYFSTDKNAGDEKLIELRAIAAVAPDKRTPEQVTRLRHYFRETQIPEVRQLVADLAELRKKESEADKAIPTIRVMEEMETGRPSHIRIRGDYRSKGEQVSAGVPTSALPPIRSVSGKTNRLDLARWLLDPNHPLTSRVTVNRFWGLFFPNPIVKTANEFGTQGELPSHPELLDWLAREFIDSGWDVKGLLKEIVMSATYRQSSRVRPEDLTRDPQNRLLARGPRLRLPAEVLRDSALAISGLLIPKLGGPSVRPYQPAGLWEEKMFGGNTYTVGKGDELYRRSLYTLWKRTVLNPTLQTFDAPDRALCAVSRPTTCTPLQAFVTLNDVTYVEAARVFAQRILLEGGTDTVARLDFALKTAIGRPPSDREREILTNVLADVRQSYAADEKSADRLTQLGDTRRPREASAVELAAWTGVANVILNLDETVTKE